MNPCKAHWSVIKSFQIFDLMTGCFNHLLHNRINHNIRWLVRKTKYNSRNLLSLQAWSWVTNSHFLDVSWISHKTISMTCRRSTVGRVRTARQGLRITAGSDWDEHTIRGKATRAYLPFHDGCHHLRVPSAAPPPRWEGFLAEAESFSCLLQEKVCGGNLQRPTKDHMKVVEQKREVRRRQPGWK